MTKQTLNRIGYATAGVTLVIASYIMFAYYHGFQGDYEGIGVLFFLIALVFNLVILGYILFISGRKGIKGPFIGIYAMLLNIPVGIFYLWFGIYLHGYYRVTVINDTPTTVTSIRLTGCGNKAIRKMEAGESETFWIGINGDCSLNITFINHQKKQRKDVVAGYLTTGMGQKDEYHISGNDNPRY